MNEYALRHSRGACVEIPDNPNHCELDTLRQYADGLDGPLAVDLFSGAGGLSLGLQQAGFNIILGVDSNKKAVATHSAHFGGASTWADLSEEAEVDRICTALDGISIALVAGGPPCQPFSRAGRNKIRSLVQTGVRPKDDSRRELWRGFVDVVAKLHPTAVLVENVPDLALGNDAIVVRQLVVALESLGYDVYPRILSASSYGVPQYRRRLILVGVPSGTPFHWPQPLAGKVTVRDAISDLPAVDGGASENPCQYDGPDTPLQHWYRIGVEDEQTKVYDHIARRVRTDDLEAFRQMDSKTKYSDLPEHLQRYRADIFRDKYKRQDWDDLCRTITAHIAKDGYWYIHPDQNRTLTIREAARLQTFPDWFRFAGFPTNAYQQIGEAVPPLLAQAVGKAILHSTLKPKTNTSHVSTGAVSTILRDWLANVPDSELMAPWRKATSLWHILIGLVLFDKLAPSARRTYWATFHDRWPTPKHYLDDDYKETAVKALGQGRITSVLTDIAGALQDEAEFDLADLPSIKGISREGIRQAMTLAGMDQRLTVRGPSVRVAERVFGEPQTNSEMIGQLLLARLVGAFTDGRAYAAVLEIGEQFCLPSEPTCELCPLQYTCQTAPTLHPRVNSRLALE